MRRVRGSFPRVLRAVHHAVFVASRHGRAAEIAGWSNALAALGIAGAAWLGFRSVAASVAALVGAFVLLRLGMAHRATLAVTALFGTVAVAAAGGGLAWTFGHLVDHPSAASIAGVLGGFASAFGPAWAFASVARHRANEVPDSLVDPVSLPPSRD